MRLRALRPGTGDAWGAESWRPGAPGTRRLTPYAGGGLCFTIGRALGVRRASARRGGSWGARPGPAGRALPPTAPPGRAGPTPPRPGPAPLAVARDAVYDILPASPYGGVAVRLLRGGRFPVGSGDGVRVWERAESGGAQGGAAATAGGAAGAGGVPGPVRPFPGGRFAPSLPQAGCWGGLLLRGVGAPLRAALAAASRPQARQRQLEEGDALGRAPSAPRGAGLRYREWQKATGNLVLSDSHLSSCVLLLVVVLICLVFHLLCDFVLTLLERAWLGLLYTLSSDICIHWWHHPHSPALHSRLNCPSSQHFL